MESKQTKGGKARAKALSPERRSEIAEKAAEARWSSDAPRALCEGPVSIGPSTIEAAVLPGGTRVLSQADFLRSIGRSRSPKAGTGILSTVDDLPFFLLPLMLLVSVIILPLSGLSFVYAVLGANVVIDKAGSNVSFKQRFLGLGVGTNDLVPFWKIRELVVEDVARAQPHAAGDEPPLDIAQWKLTLVKKSGTRLELGTRTCWIHPSVTRRFVTAPAAAGSRDRAGMRYQIGPRMGASLSAATASATSMTRSRPSSSRCRGTL